jgi:lipoprotein-anchoring transpeptidase ErfK/SrfK
MQKKSKNNTRLYLFIGAMGVLLCAVFAVAAWTAVNHPAFASILNSAPAPTPIAQEKLWAQVDIAKPVAHLDISAFVAPELAVTPVPSPAVSAVNEPTALPTDAPTSTPTIEPTPTITETPAQLAMDIVPNTPTSVYVPPTYSAPDQVYASSGNGSRWIDVDLTNQRVYAYEGDVVVNSFLVSTGTWATPTVTGRYNIYVKIASGNMHGPGYFLPDVPYIMYFYKGYGLHGTYWHNNFGTPMSHGCVNLRTDEAGWLFNWASVGTLVNVHY